MQKLEGDKVKLDKVVYTAFMKACAGSPDLLEPAHAVFKRMIWGPRRMKPSQVCLPMLCWAELVGQIACLSNTQLYALMKCVSQ